MGREVQASPTADVSAPAGNGSLGLVPNEAGPPAVEIPDGAYILYTAVLPRYRQACMEVLAAELGSSFRAFAGECHLDGTVRTDLPADLYSAVTNRGFLGRRVLVQTGHWRPVLAARTAIMDLNPRSLTVWILLLARRSLGRRTLLWGHLYPHRGAAHRTAGLRRLLRFLSSGTVLYGYDSVEPALRDSPRQPVWVAPNALYPARDLRAGEGDDPRSVLYVGRLEAAKKVGRLLTAYAISGLARQGFRLALVGQGAQRGTLVEQAASLGISDSMDFIGSVYETDRLRDIYADAVCSVSPGYAGLSLTQSIGFGVPVLVSRDEAHSPEIELAATGAVTYFDTADDADFALQLRTMVADRPCAATRENWRAYVRQRYSAEAMSDGLVRAFRNQRQELGGHPDAGA